ncbi:hypothetical protein QFZ82_003199 [Streptomyces sp. V4I23]|nr:hypothetical protein [Streptomyces sp. V4I23]
MMRILRRARPTTVLDRAAHGADRPGGAAAGRARTRYGCSGTWQTASTLLPSGSRTNAP